MENDMPEKTCEDCFHFKACANAFGTFGVDIECNLEPCKLFQSKDNVIVTPCKLGDLIPVRYNGDNCNFRASSVIYDPRIGLQIVLRDAINRVKGRYTFDEIESLIDTNGVYIDKDIAALYPCETCGCADVRISKSIHPLTGTELYAAFCMKCGNWTRESQIKNVVIHLWNKEQQSKRGQHEKN